MTFIIVMTTVAMVNLLVAQGRIFHNTLRDGKRLKAAIQSELTELLSFQNENSRRIKEGQMFILSSRACTSVYRGNVGRIILIPDKEIQVLVRAYALSEQAEHFIAATTKQYGPMTYKIIEKETLVDEIIVVLERSQAAIRAALSVLTRNPEA